MKKIYLMAMASAIAVPAVVVPVVTEAEVGSTTVTKSVGNEKTFKDVSKKSPYYDTIHTMASQGIISGYEDGTFRPSDKLSRKHAASLVTRVKGAEFIKMNDLSNFNDVKISNPHYSGIKKLVQAGIYTLDSKGNVNLDKEVTRGEMAKILTYAFNLKQHSLEQFKDVSTYDENYEYIRALYSSGITTGDNGKYKPNDSVTRVNFAVFMSRSIERVGNQKNLSEMTDNDFDKLEGLDLLRYIDMYKYEFARKAPLPEGIKDRDKFIKEHKQRVKVERDKSLVGSGETTMSLRATKYDPLMVKNLAKRVGIDVAEFIGLLNRAVNTGEVLSTDKYLIYFDYEENVMYVRL